MNAPLHELERLGELLSGGLGGRELDTALQESIHRGSVACSRADKNDRGVNWLPQSRDDPRVDPAHLYEVLVGFSSIRSASFTVRSDGSGGFHQIHFSLVFAESFP